jgi:hypothetical protein
MLKNRMSMLGRVLITSAILAGMISAANAEIQLVKPVDGSTVRETVNILVPVSSIPPSGFVAYTIDGIFKAAMATKTPDGESFIYKWDTKALDISLPANEQRVREGQHTIMVQACDAGGKVVGPQRQVTVYVKNQLNADMPSSGLKLRYRMKPGSKDKYAFRYVLNIKSIAGKTDGADYLKDIEGAEGAIIRSVEDAMDDDSSLIQITPSGTLRTLSAGRSIPVTLNETPYYCVQDGTGHADYSIKSSQSGQAVSLNLPILPAGKVKIGTTWRSRETVFKDILSGVSVDLPLSNKLESLEWEKGYPCAKIVSTFSGSVRVPFSKMVPGSVNVTGERITYFAYQTGRIVSSTTTATADADVSGNVVKGYSDALLPKKVEEAPRPAASRGGGNNRAPGMALPGGIPMPPGMGGMEEDMDRPPVPPMAPSVDGMPEDGIIPQAGPGTPASVPETVNIKVEIKQYIEGVLPVK